MKNAAHLLREREAWISTLGRLPKSSQDIIMEMDSRNMASIFEKAIAVLLLMTPNIILLSPNNALADEMWRGADVSGWHRPAFGTIGVAAIPFVNGIYEYPYDYGGYGEYAEYGPWAHRHQRGCRIVREPVWTGDGWLSRKLQICG
jgi:hypothetical protein